jgi:hypothetical protein
MAVVACQERLPTALDDGRLPDEPLTVEVDLDWSQFGSNLQVIGGYGSVTTLPRPIVAHTYQGTLESRMLLRFGPYPAAARVVDPSGATVTDPDVTYVGGRLVLTFDTLASTNTGQVALQVSALSDEWHPASASWGFAVDTVGDQRAWTEAGAGPLDLLASTVWDPVTGDTVSLQLDSADVARWVDIADMSRGARVETTTDGVRLQLRQARLRITMRPTIDPDTLVEDTTAQVIEKTFIYDPPPPAPTGIRVGGAPAWRTVMTVAVPALTGPPDLCAAVGCPYTPAAGDISYAALVLTSQATEAAFQPSDTMLLDVRPVLSPPALPKSPLGASQTGGVGAPVAPELFGASAGTDVEIPVTFFVRTLLAPASGGSSPPATLVLLAANEPGSMTFASFFGSADPDPPVLRLIITVGTPQVLP